MTTVDRTMPEPMRKLIRLALETGLDAVQFSFEGLSFDFAAPIGWILHLSRVDPIVVGHIPQDSNHLTINCQIGSEPDAYVGPVDGSESPYLDAQQIADWITAPREGIPAYTAVEKAQFAQDADLFLETIDKGWHPARTLGRHNALTLDELLPGAGPHQIHVTYEFAALNWFYSVEGHPASQEMGAAVSENRVLIKRSITDVSAFYCTIDGKKTVESSVRDPLTRTAPWFAPVAYFDRNLEDWVL